MHRIKLTNALAKQVVEMRETLPGVTDLLRLGRAVAFKKFKEPLIRQRASKILDYKEYPDMTEIEIVNHLYQLSQMDDPDAQKTPCEVA